MILPNTFEREDCSSFLRTHTADERTLRAGISPGLQTAQSVLCKVTDSPPHAVLSVAKLLHISHSTPPTTSITALVDLAMPRHRMSSCASEAAPLLCTGAGCAPTPPTHTKKRPLLRMNTMRSGMCAYHRDACSCPAALHLPNPYTAQTRHEQLAAHNQRYAGIQPSTNTVAALSQH
jgi:hypothetical protein